MPCWRLYLARICYVRCASGVSTSIHMYPCGRHTRSEVGSVTMARHVNSLESACIDRRCRYAVLFIGHGGDQDASGKGHPASANALAGHARGQTLSCHMRGGHRVCRHGSRPETARSMASTRVRVS